MWRLHACWALPVCVLSLGAPVWAQVPGASPGTPAATTYIEGDRLSGRTDLDAVVEGDAQLQRGKTTVNADVLEYYQPTDQARATGNVRLNQDGNLYEGPLLELKVEAFEGFFQEPVYHFKQGDAHGEATRADFIDQDNMVVRDATYTTCRRVPGPDWVPDWILRASSIAFDNAAEVGVAEDAHIDFKGVPILPVPSISFPLTDKRKSGFLPPTLDPFNSINGATVAQPYYWNIAPNRDATITPTLMTARGVDMGLEYRYLEPTYTGDVKLNYMPDDMLRSTDRWGLAWNQMGHFHPDVAGAGDVNVVVNINRVSDDNYWMDFGNASTALTQRLLPGDVLTNWNIGNLSGAVHVAKWQTLQQADSPITPPYDRLPQLTLRYAQTNVNGYDWSVDGDYTQFQADPSLTLQPNAQRMFALAQVSRPWLMPQGFITPKLQLHTAGYQFDAPLADGSQTSSVTVPTFSLDSGLVFERNTTLWGRDYLQTLEPRAFYVYTPFRNQSLLPLYDTAVADFNFASIYTENAYVGNDRISDNNLLTLGVSSRFLDPQTGAQYANFALAQRLRFNEQYVTINADTPPADIGFSDMMLGATINTSRTWAFDSTVQYNPLTEESDRSTVGARYNPSDYHVVNIAYRFQRDVSEQIDLSWQWPINDLWGDRGENMGPGKGQGAGRYYAVGRMNYSIDQADMVDMVLGVEYDAGCWLGRVVYSRNQTSTSTAVERIMIQLEFVGFSRVGMDPLSTLKQNISHYQSLRNNGSSTDDHIGNYN